MSDTQNEPVKPEASYTLTPSVKQGHKCCGGCCDMRRAVIIVNLVNILLLVLGTMGTLSLLEINKSATDDDKVAETLEEFNNLSLAGFITTQCVKIVVSILGIVGAIRYNIILVGICVAMYAANCIWAAVFLNIAGVVYAVFFAYPHFFFMNEVRAGIMSQENYKVNEEQSCCCV